MGVGLRKVNWTEEKLKIDRPEVEKAIQAAEVDRKFWEGRTAHCRQALELMRQARPKVFPGSREELDYVIYKTKNFITVFEEISAVNEAKAAYDRAVLARNDGKADEVGKQLGQSQTASAAIRFPSGLQATVDCPSITSASCSWEGRQNLTVPSTLPEAIQSPLGDQSTAWMRYRCPGKSLICLPVSASQIRTRLSSPPETTR